jgi:hypothetical protein
MRLPINEFLADTGRHWLKPNATSYWHAASEARLKVYVDAGKPVDEIAELFGRSRTAILSRMIFNNIIKRNELTGEYTYMNPEDCKIAKANPVAPVPALWETKCYINGRDASSMTDEEIFAAIAQAEARVGRYKDIIYKPEKLKKAILDLHDQIGKLVEFVDSRK